MIVLAHVPSDEASNIALAVEISFIRTLPLSQMTLAQRD
jgi:hypothetical protein